MAPVTEAYQSSIWVIHQEYEDGDTGLLEAHVSHESALAAIKSMGHMKVDLHELQLKSVVDIEASTKKSKKKSSGSSSSSKKGKKVKDSDTEGDEEDDSSDSEGSTKAKSERNTLPDLSNMKQNCLDGSKIMFVGNFEKVRKVLQAVAIFAGAVSTSSAKVADYIVLGDKPGPKRLEKIEEEGRETISEHDFYTMLQTGFPKRKRRHSVDEAESDEAPKKKHKK